MATYETGSSTGANDLLSKLKAFMEANGWTTDGYTTVGSGYRLHAHKGAQFINIRSLQNETLNNIFNGCDATTWYGLAMNGSDSYNGSLGWQLQPGGPDDGASEGYGGCLYFPGGSAALPSYHFHALPDDTIWVSVEVAATKYKAMGWGRVNRYNTSAAYGYWTFTTDVKVTSSLAFTAEGMTSYHSAASAALFPFDDRPNASNKNVSSWLRCSYDLFDGWAQAGGSVLTPANTLITGGCVSARSVWDSANLYNASLSPFNWKNVMLPQQLFLNKTTTGRYLPVGELSFFRRMRMDQYVAAEEFVLGSDTWQVFPLYQKGGAFGSLGYAIKKA